MSNINVYKVDINKEKFLKSKDKLKVFSQRAKSNVEIPKVADSEMWIFDHNVTGRELNQVTEKVQGVLVKLNNLQIDTIKEFMEVYDTLEYLDKEYLNGIVMSLKEAEKVDKEIKREQLRLNNIMETLKKTIDTLEKFDEIACRNFESVDARIGCLSENIQNMEGRNNIIIKAVNECQKKIFDTETSVLLLQESIQKEKKAFIIAWAAIIGVVIEALIICSMLL